MSVLNYLTNTAAALVLSSSEKSSIDTSISTLKTRLNSWFEDNIKEQIRFGSSTRGTILPRNADRKSDIDYMIVFDNTNDYKPYTFVERLKKFAENYYSTSEIHQSHPTVVLILNHIQFDLVPAYKSSGFLNTLYIPGPSSGFVNWISTDPNGFNQRLSDKNNSNNSLIKPMIRLIKYWNACNDYVYNSYELEQKLVDNSYWFCSNLKEYFFSAVNNLGTWSLSQVKSERVQRAKDIVAKVKELEENNMPDKAEAEQQKLIPLL